MQSDEQNTTLTLTGRGSNSIEAEESAQKPSNKWLIILSILWKSTSNFDCLKMPKLKCNGCQI